MQGRLAIVPLSVSTRCYIFIENFVQQGALHLMLHWKLLIGRVSMIALGMGESLVVTVALNLIDNLLIRALVKDLNNWWIVLWVSFTKLNLRHYLGDLG